MVWGLISCFSDHCVGAGGGRSSAGAPVSAWLGTAQPVTESGPAAPPCVCVPGHGRRGHATRSLATAAKQLEECGNNPHTGTSNM